VETNSSVDSPIFEEGLYDVSAGDSKRPKIRTLRLRGIYILGIITLNPINGIRSNSTFLNENLGKVGLNNNAISLTT